MTQEKGAFWNGVFTGSILTLIIASILILIEDKNKLNIIHNCDDEYFEPNRLLIVDSIKSNNIYISDYNK